jgi:hypothetical protein
MGEQKYCFTLLAFITVCTELQKMFKKEKQMKEKKILIAVLLSMATQVQAVRSPLQKPAETVDVVEEMPVKKDKKIKKDKEKASKHVKAKKEEDSSSHEKSGRRASRNTTSEPDETVLEKLRKEKDDKHQAVREKRVERKQAAHEKKQKREDEGKESKRGYRNEGLEKTDEQLAPLKEKVEKKHEVVRKKREMKKEGLYTKEDRKNEGKEKKEVEKKTTVKQRVEKKKEEVQQRDKGLDKKRADLEKSIKKLENELTDLENKRASAVREEEEDRAANDKEGSKRHVINHGSVKLDSLDKEIKDRKEMLARKEEALVKLSKDVREDKREERQNRLALAKIYENNQKDLREELTKVQDAIKALRVEEVQAKNELYDNREVAEEHIKKLREAETRHDSLEVDAHKKSLLMKDSEEMKALQAKEKRVRHDLAVLRKKIEENDKASQLAAKEAGIRLELRKERHEKDIDRMIKEDKKPRVLTQTAREVKDRKEELEHEKMVQKEKRMQRRSSMPEEMTRRNSKKMNESSEKKMMKKKKPNEVVRDFNMIEEEDHA